MPAALPARRARDLERRRALGEGVARRLGRQRIEDLVDRRRRRSPSATIRRWRTSPDRSRARSAATHTCPRRYPAPCGPPGSCSRACRRSTPGRLRRGHLDVPVGPHDRVGRVLVVGQDDRPIGRRDDQEAHREQEQERRGEAGTGRAAQLAARQVDRHALRPSDPTVHPMEHEQQQAQHQERGGEQQQRRRQQHQRVDRARAGRRLRAAPQLDEREDARPAARSVRRARGTAADDPPATAPVVPPARSVRCRGARAASRMSAPIAAVKRPSAVADGFSCTGNSTPGSDGPFVRPARLASPKPIRRPSGNATSAASVACTPCASNSVRREKPRLCSTDSSNACRVSVSAATPASTASVTAPIWNTTSRIGTRRFSTR